MSCLLIEAHLHTGRFHGLDTESRPEWPPSAARLFQALVAAASKGAVLEDGDVRVLKWLEGLKPPVIAAPATHSGQAFSHFMPNNDLDAKGGNSRRIGEVRSATKRYHPKIFDAKTPVLYLWSFEGDETNARRICGIAEQLYQLGRGIDMAWATGEVVAEDEAESRLEGSPAAIYRPALNGTGNWLSCPDAGSLDSLIVRYAANQRRFKDQLAPAPTKKEPSRRKVIGRTFAQPPKPHFRQVAYGSPSTRLLYELRDGDRSAGFHVWPLREVSALVKIVRDDCADRLEKSLKSEFPDKAGAMKRVFGLCRDATEADKASRIRIIPLPSIGHAHADRGIRRILVEVPPNCPLSAKDIDWAFAGFCKFDPSTGEIGWMLTKADEHTMLDHFGAGDDSDPGFRVWRTVTPMALPIERPHGRNGGMPRAAIEAHAAGAVVQALRHAGVTQKPSSIRVQREPFDTKGALAQNFAANTRFDSRRLWHVELLFAQPIRGPLLAGNGRYLGLGLMASVQQTDGVVVFSITGGLAPDADSVIVARALRRAVMARVQAVIGKRERLPLFFTGHEVNGAVARGTGRSHLAFAFDKLQQRVLVIAPHLLEKREPTNGDRRQLQILNSAMGDLSELRAGSAGRLRLCVTSVDEGDPLFAQSSTWATRTVYRPTRYSKILAPDQAVIADVQLELRRRGLPNAERIETTRISVGPRGGFNAHVKLKFATGVTGPLLLGKTSSFGGGLFAAIDK